jgi:hypothetical protein
VSVLARLIPAAAWVRRRPPDHRVGHGHLMADPGDGLAHLGRTPPRRAAACSRGWLLGWLSPRGLPDQPRDRSAGLAAIGAVLADLDGQDLGGTGRTGGGRKGGLTPSG